VVVVERKTSAQQRRRRLTYHQSLANPESEEPFKPSYFGFAEEAIQERISDDELFLIQGTKVVNSASIIL